MQAQKHILIPLPAFFSYFARALWDEFIASPNNYYLFFEGRPLFSSLPLSSLQVDEIRSFLLLDPIASCAYIIA